MEAGANDAKCVGVTGPTHTVHQAQTHAQVRSRFKHLGLC